MLASISASISGFNDLVLFWVWEIDDFTDNDLPYSMRPYIYTNSMQVYCWVCVFFPNVIYVYAAALGFYNRFNVFAARKSRSVS